MTTTQQLELDELTTPDVVARLLDAQERVVPAVRATAPSIADAATLIADALRAGGRLVLAGAGTSGRLAVLQAAELPGTFGLRPGVVRVRVAGGGRHVLDGTDADEDDVDAGRSAAADLTSVDVVVAVAASGRTPYTCALAGAARERGSRVVAVVNQPGSLLAGLACVVVQTGIGEEVLRGSTRLGAGTAAKVALDALTTAAMVRLGRVHGDQMVDVVAANAKLRDRVVGIVASITGGTADRARSDLVRCDWNARAAVLTAIAGLAPSDAVALAARHATLRAAVAAAVTP